MYNVWINSIPQERVNVSLNMSNANSYYIRINQLPTYSLVQAPNDKSSAWN